ncbi:efflux RND transporter permease subunit [Cupriavidus oxalaticus]|uniref:efflux RND transporter permease subunit n=1 Tax=Cupriavidus sp. IK-TO18 TaxID=2782182 RepID=UPI001F0DE296|nr:efflux RND transporter permease subunit [Cupriavidus oxalaticus]
MTSVVEAAGRAARQRLRPVVMTSLAFVLGTLAVPLLYAAIARRLPKAQAERHDAAATQPPAA